LDGSYDSYNLDKGPVFYEAYYPDARDAYQDKRYFDRSAVLERSFQVPFKRLAYSAEVDRPFTSNESVVVVDSEEPDERRETPESRRTYDAADKTARSQDDHPSTVFNDGEKLESASVEEISKLIRRAISRDLENWNALERYLDRAANQNPLIAQPAVYSGENRRNKEDNSYLFSKNRQSFDSQQQPGFELLRKLEDARQRPMYLEQTENANENTRTNAMSVTQAVAPAIGVISDSLPMENIFQPRPQVIRYTFFKEPAPQLDEQAKKAIDNSTPRSYGDNLIREEIANSHGKQAEENVKVTSIEVSELPRHKTRHHHGEWPKRDYSAHRHRSQTTAA